MAFINEFQNVLVLCWFFNLVLNHLFKIIRYIYSIINAMYVYLQIPSLFFNILSAQSWNRK